MLKLKSISPSRIKTFDMCKFKYWLTYNSPDVELKSNWGAAHGSLLHDILEFKSNGVDPDWMDRLYRGYGGTLDTYDRYGKPEIMESPLRWAKPQEFHNQTPHCDSCCYKGENECIISKEPLDKLSGCARMLFDNSISMLETVIDDYTDVWERILRDPNGVICGAEYPYRLPVQGTDVPMIGIMDLVVEEDPDTIRIYDYKTGKWTQTYEECREDIQIKMYSLAARKEFIEDINGKGYNYKNVLLTFDYFTKSPITLAFTAEEDAATEVYVRDKINEIQNTEWIDRIVKDNSDFEKRWAWKCRSLCDTDVCKDKWQKAFKTNP
jgi:hypothetical protein